MSTKIARINQIAKEKPKEVFTSIYHLINYELLKECFDKLDGNKATGLDKVTKDMYLMNLDENLNKLVDKLKTKSYRPSPARKVNIPKSNGKLRGLAIANFEDKIVQHLIPFSSVKNWSKGFARMMIRTHFRHLIAFIEERQRLC